MAGLQSGGKNFLLKDGGVFCERSLFCLFGWFVEGFGAEMSLGGAELRG